MLCDVQALASRNFSALSLPLWNAALRPLYEEIHSNLLENDRPHEVQTSFSS